MIADMEAAEAAQKARRKERKAIDKIVKAKATGDCSADKLPTIPSTKASAKASASSTLPAKPGSIAPAASKDSPPAMSPTGFYCGRCAHYFKSAIHLKIHFQMSTAHHVFDVCKEDIESWKGLLIHYQATGHAIICQECCRGNGNAFPADGVAYRSHLEIQHVCKTCNRHCGSQVALDEV